MSYVTYRFYRAESVPSYFLTITIRSTIEPNGVVWQQSNVDGFSHHWHDGIFRPVYFGDMEAVPTQGFEYWKPNWFGYSRKQFPTTKNPYYNFMGEGYTVDRGMWESDLGVTGKRFGTFIGGGEEQSVFQDTANPDKVLKVMDFYRKDMPFLKRWTSNLSATRNAIPLQEPIKLEGIISNGGYPFPVFSQAKLTPLGSIPSVEFNQKYLPLIQKELASFGYTGNGISSEFSNGLNTLVDIKPENMG